MARLIQLFLLSSILAVVCCHPWGFGLGGKLESRTNLAGETNAEAGDEKDYKVTSKSRGLFDWIGSLTGGGYLGNHGIAGTLGSNVGVGVDGKGAVSGNGEITENTAEGHIDGQAVINKEAHANVYGDINTYTADEVKRLYSSNMKPHDNNETKNGARNSKSSGRW